MRGTLSYSRIMSGTSNYVGYLKLFRVPWILLELFRVPWIILELFRVLELCWSYSGYLELYGVPQSMWDTSSYFGVMRGTSDHAGYL